jgi:hypothetical protein
MAWLNAIFQIIGNALRWFVERELNRKDAAGKANTEMSAEIANADRRKANEIRDRVDAARIGGGLHPKPNDTRGYRD